MDLKKMREFQAQHDEDKRIQEKLGELEKLMVYTKGAPLGVASKNQRRVMGIPESGLWTSAEQASKQNLFKTTSDFDRLMNSIGSSDQLTTMDVMKQFGIPKKYYSDVARILQQGREETIKTWSSENEGPGNFDFLDKIDELKEKRKKYLGE